MKKPAPRENLCLYAILLGFILLGTTYSIVTPIFEAPDELYHYALVDYVAAHWALPVQPHALGATSGPWAQEGSQPPLAYLSGALIAAVLQPSDFSVVYQPNPYAALGEAHPDGSNVNAAIHSPIHERWPWHGTVLAVHLVRLLAVFYGVCAIYLTWRLVRELWPHQRWLANGTAAIHAFTPMFIFVSAAVNNDALLIPLCTLALLQVVRLVKATQPRWRDFVYLGVIIGCAVLTKESALALLPFAAIAALLATWQSAPFSSKSGNFRQEIGQTGLTLAKYYLAWALPLVAVAGWWYARNVWLYNDILGLNGFLALVGRRLYPPDLWQESPSLLRSYWGIFGWFNLPMPNWVYVGLNTLLVIAGIGLAKQLFSWIRRAKQQTYAWHWDRSTWALVLLWIWPLVVLIALLRWTSLTPASQGRLLFPAISVLSLGLLLGVTAWWPAKSQLAGALGVFLAGLSLVAPGLWIAPAYQFPTPLSAAQIANIEHPLRVDFGDHLRLLGYDLDQTMVYPGDMLKVALYWQGQKPTTTHHVVYIHVLGEGERIVAQRDAFPGRGLFSSTELIPGMTWLEHYQILVPRMAYTPDQLSLAVGVYEMTSSQRLPGEAHLGKIVLQPHTATAPLDVRFGPGLHLVAYKLNKVAIERGETLTLTVDWQSSAPLVENYTVSVQVINVVGQKAAQIDSTPSIPTTKWIQGQQVEEKYRLTTDANAPPGLYDIRLVMYTKDKNDELELLPIVWDVNHMPEDNIVLTQVHIKAIPEQ
jgi:hypothetical protein